MMKLISKEKEASYCNGIIVGYDNIYVVDRIPKDKEYIVVNNKEGYVVCKNYNEELNCYDVYLEKNLGDWDNQIIEICDIVYLKEC